MPADLAAKPQHIVLLGPWNRPVPCQVETLVPKGRMNAKWVRIDFFADLAAFERVAFRPAKGEPPSVAAPARAAGNGSLFEIGNEHFCIRLDARRFTLLGDFPPYAGAESKSALTVDRLAVCPEVRIRVISNGPICAELRVEGEHRNLDGTRPFSFLLIYRAIAGVPALFLDHTFIHTDDRPDDKELSSVRMDFDFNRLKNPVIEVIQLCADHDSAVRAVPIRGRADLASGRGKSRKFSDVSMDIEDATPLAWSEPMHPLFAPHARQVVPLVRLRATGQGVTLRFEDAHVHAPKSLHAEGRVLSAGIWPDWAGPLRVPQGLAKTHRLALVFWANDPGPAEAAARNIFNPGRLACDASFFRHNCLLDQHLLLAYEPKRYPHVECAWASAFNLIWPKGFMHYGDTYASSYRAGYENLDPSDQVYLNNEYDLLFVLCQEHVRTGRAVYYKLAAAMAQHICDIDVFHHSNPYPVMKGAMRAHGLNHVENTGFPSHQWVEGLLAFHVLSGNPRMLEVAEMIGANWIAWLKNRWHIMAKHNRDKHWMLIGLSALYEFTGKTVYGDAARETFAGVVREYKEVSGRDPDWPDGDDSLALWGFQLMMAAVKRYHQATGEPEAERLLERLADALLQAVTAEGVIPAVRFEPAESVSVWHQLYMPALAYLDFTTANLRHIRPNRTRYKRLVLSLRVGWWASIACHYGNYPSQTNPDGRARAWWYRMMYGMAIAHAHGDMGPLENCGWVPAVSVK